MSEKISVIVPVYNVRKEIENCIESILNQSFKNLEIILVDDGSTDGSGKICDRYAKKDDRVIVFHKENGGVSSARNVGLKAATGNYIGFVDSDDWIEATMYEELYDMMEKGFANLSISGIYVNNWPEYTEEKKGRLSQERAIKLCLGLTEEKPCLMSGICNKLFQKEILNGLYLDETLYIGEDMLFLIQAIQRSKRINYTTKSLYHYIQRNTSAIHTISRKHLSDIISHEEVLKILKGNSELTELVTRRMCNNCINLLLNCAEQKIWDKKMILYLQKYVKKSPIYSYRQGTLLKKIYERLICLSYTSYFVFGNARNILTTIIWGGGKREKIEQCKIYIQELLKYRYLFSKFYSEKITVSTEEAYKTLAEFYNHKKEMAQPEVTEKKETKQLSIIIPIYNCDSYLDECLKSILTQYMPFLYEVLLIDDGSTDNSKEIAQKYESENVHYIY